MFRNILTLVACVAVVGCGTPSEVHMVDKKDPDVAMDGYYYQTDPITVSHAQGKLLYEHQLTEALAEVNAAETDDELEHATKKLEAVKSARPADPVKVAGTIMNSGRQDLLAVVFADPSCGHRLGSLPLPAGSERTFYLPKGIRAHLVFYARNREVGCYTLDNPADTGWIVWAQ